MTTTSWILLAVTGIFAVTDWWATQTKRVSVRYVAKPATLAFLIGVAVTLEPAVSPGIRTAMVVGLVLSLAGDIFLMLPPKWFVGGLVAFLLGHIAYVVGLQMADTSVVGTLIGLVVVGACIAVIGRRLLGSLSASGNGQMVGPVAAYLVVISAMVVSAFGTGSPWAIVGAFLFYVSDATLAWNRFVQPLSWGPLTVMTTYHLGQAGLVAWLVWP